MKTALSLATLVFGVFAARLATADEAITPPAGWEVSPVVSASNDKPDKGKKKPVGPACCAYDQTCCSRQADIDAQVHPRFVKRIIEVRIADLPEATIKEAAEGAPPIEDAPPVRLINEDGKPFPWVKAPREIRMLPPGPLGDINWNSEWGASPSFDEDELKGLGWGLVRYPKDGESYSNDAYITGKVEYLSVQQGEGEKLLLDIVKGTISGTPKIKATYYLHVEAAHIVDKVVHAYRATTKEKDVTTTWVNFLLPQVVEGFESKDAKHQGGFFPSRFSRWWSYSLYRLPFGPGRSNMATFRLDDDDKRRWIGVDKKRPPKVWMRQMLVSASQTSVESEPVARVVFFEDFTVTF